MKIAIIGLGWLGSALGFAAKSVYPNAEVIGHDKDPDAAKKAEQIKAVDKTNWNLPAACDGASLIFLAIPSEEVETTLQAVGKYLVEGTIVADASGAALTALNGPARLLPANVSYLNCDISFNPLTSEDAPSAGVFKGAVWFICPRHGAPADSINAIANFADQLHASSVFMDPAEHDGLSLSVNAIPASILAVYMDAVSADEAWKERIWLAGTPFAQNTRALEKAHPAGISRALLQQKEASLHWLNQVMFGLMDLRDAVSAGDAKKVEAIISLAQEHRNEWINTWQKGRDAKPAQPEVQRNSLMGMFMGQKLAKQMGDKK